MRAVLVVFWLFILSRVAYSYAEALVSAPPLQGELTAEEMWRLTARVVSDWRTVGTLAGLIALINLLINLLRIPAIDRWLAARQKKWLKPLASAMLGAILTALSTLATGADLGASLVAGLLFGLSAVGFHEIVDKRHPEARQR